MKRWTVWDLRPEIFWSRLWVWAISLVCCRRKCETAVCTAWSWTLFPGTIAKQLYPKADITVGGFETTDRRDFFDLAIGNVPFGQYQSMTKPTTS